MLSKCSGALRSMLDHRGQDMVLRGSTKSDLTLHSSATQYRACHAWLANQRKCMAHKLQHRERIRSMETEGATNEGRRNGLYNEPPPCLPPTHLCTEMWSVARNVLVIPRKDQAFAGWRAAAWVGKSSHIQRETSKVQVG